MAKVLEFQLQHQSFCCRKEDPFQGPKLGPCLTLGNELSEETHVLTKQEILLGKGTQGESRRVREPRRTALPRVGGGLLVPYSLRNMEYDRISCHKTTHANGYYGTWPGWVVSISVLPLTQSLIHSSVSSNLLLIPSSVFFCFSYYILQLWLVLLYLLTYLLKFSLC